MNELTALTNPLWPAANRRPRATINPASSRNKRAEKIRKASRGFITIHRTITAAVRISPITTIHVVFEVRVVPMFAIPESPTTEPQLASAGPREKVTNQYGRIAAYTIASRAREGPALDDGTGCRT